VTGWYRHDGTGVLAKEVPDYIKVDFRDWND